MTNQAKEKTMPRPLSSYRPQHDEDCTIYQCVECGAHRSDTFAHGYDKACDDFTPFSCSCGLTAALAREAQTDTLARFDEVLRSKFTPALNTGTAMDMLILVSETIREVRASSPSPGVLPEAQQALVPQSPPTKDAK